MVLSLDEKGGHVYCIIAKVLSSRPPQSTLILGSNVGVALRGNLNVVYL